MRSKLLSTTIVFVVALTLCTCKTKEGPKVLPTVTTVSIFDVTDSTATIKGNMPDEGSSPIEKVGVCWALIPSPTRLDSHLFSGPVKGDFQFNARGFKNKTTYFVRAYAENGGGVTFGNELTFKTKPGWVSCSPGSIAYVTSVLTLGDNSVFIGTSAGIYKSSNSGQTWTISSTGLTNSKVNCLVGNGNSIFAGTEGGVFRSNDGGATWTTVNGVLSSLNVNVLACFVSNIYVGTNNGVFYSIDNGDSWNPTINIPGITNITLLAAFSNKIFAGSKLKREVYESVNQGSTWTKLTKDFTNEAPSALCVSGSVLVLGTETGLYYSHDKGANFDKVQNFNVPVNCINISFSSTFAGGQGKVESFYQSKDLGVTFTTTESPGDYTTVSAISIAANESYIFAVSGDKLYRMKS